jgi:membrane protein YdbS with pleckstrin-like domain
MEGAPVDRIIFSLRPLFVGRATLTALLPFALFFALWSGAFFRNLLNISWLAPGGLTFLLVLGLGYVAKKLNYSRTEYRFYDDRLEFDEGFFALNRKTIDYRDVRETTLHKGFLQRTCDLGTIYLGTITTGTSSNLNPFLAFGFASASASGVAHLIFLIPTPHSKKSGGFARSGEHLNEVGGESKGRPRLGSR